MKLTLLELLYAAWHSEHGVAVKCENPQLLRGQLYKTRAEDSDLMSLSVILSPQSPSDEIWILKERPNVKTPD